MGKRTVNDFFLDLASKFGHISYNAKGNNPDVDSGSTPEDILPSGGTYTFPTAAAKVDVSSDSANDSGNNPDYSFSPDEISALFAWYRMDNVVSAGGNVTSLTDLSGNGYTATAQGSSISAPTNNSSLNNQPTITCNGGYFQLDGSLAEELNGDSGFTFLAILKKSNNFQSDTIYDINFLNTINKVFGETRSNNTYYSTVLSSLSGSTKTASGGSITLDWASYEYNTDLSNDRIDIYENASSEVSATSLGFFQNTFATNGVTNNYLFYNDATAVVGDYEVAEILMFDKSISSAERDQISFYLNDRYDLGLSFAGGNPSGTNGTGARTIKVKGLDSNWDIAEETLILNGTTTVESANSYIRFWEAKSLTAGSSEKNEGNITLTHKNASTLFGYIAANEGQTRQSIFSIPRNYDGYLMDARLSVGRVARSIAEAVIMTKENGGSWVFEDTLNAHANGTTEDKIDYTVPLQLEEKSDIKLQVTSCSTNNTFISGSLQLILKQKGRS